MSRKTASNGSPFEGKIGFSRVVRTGPVIAVSGTAPINADGSVSEDMESQTRRAFEIIKWGLEQVGAKLDHVTRTRIMLTDIKNWEAAAKVHGELFGTIRPVTTFVEVTGFIDPRWLVEIEADAYIHDE